MAGLMKFSVAALNEIDGGRLRVAVEKLIKRAVEDCRDRPALDSARKITLELSLSPTCDDATGDCESVWLEYKTKLTVPALSRDGVSLGVQKNGDLVFNENSINNVNQRTVFDHENAEEDNGKQN